MYSIRDANTGRSWATARELIEHIVAVYHGYLRIALPALKKLTAQIAGDRLVPATLADQLQRQVAALADMIETHCARQERWVFPKILRLRKPVGEIGWATQIDEALNRDIHQLTADNAEAVALLNQIRASFSDRRWLGKGPTVALLIEDIRELQQNFAAHSRLEIDVLFPYAHSMVQSAHLAL